jgi:ketosteroid isomerase-like protein
VVIHAIGLQVNDQQNGPVMQVFESYKDAVHAKDVDAFLAIYDENVHVFDSWAQWEYVGTEAWLVMVREWFRRSRRQAG